MNEDSTIPIGAQGQTIDGARAIAPAAASTAGTADSWGSFRLLGRVGQGGFGEVYRAWDPHLQREVALKLLLAGAVKGEAEYEAMLREARALASVRHPNIVPVYGIDRHDGRVGFWTDFVRGKTLSVLVAEQGTFGAREAALIGLDVARARSAVHRAGLLHRDIKAENVMREEGGRILLMDFGLSAFEQRQTNIAGTPNYMAPELFAAGKSSVATDIYALGVLLYFLVSGDYPVRLGGLAIQGIAEMFSRRRPLMDLRPDLPESLLRTVSTATDIDPAKRFQSAGELAGALAESLGTHEPVEVSVAPPAPVKKTAAKWILGGLLAAAVVLAASLIGYQMRPGPAPAAATPALTAENLDQFQKAQDLLLHSYKDSNVADAVKGFAAVLKADPENALAEADLGAAHFIQYKRSRDHTLLDLATRETRAAMQHGPELAAPYITLSRIAAFQGKTDVAMQYAHEALKKEERNAEAHGALGEVYEAQGKTDEAIKAYKQAIDFAPGDWRWPMSLGVAEFDRASAEETIRQFQKAIELAPDNGVAYYDLSLVHTQAGQVDAAREDLEKSIQIEPTDQAYSALGSVFLIEGKYDQAAANYLKAIQLNARNYEAYYNLGNAYERAGNQRESARQAYRRCLELAEAQQKHRPKDSLLAVILGYVYAELGENDKSEQSLRHALALDPDEPTVRYIAGETYETLGKRAEAIPDIAFALAQGYRSYEFERNPRLASLRADPRFAQALNAAKAKKQ